LVAALPAVPPDVARLTASGLPAGAFMTPWWGLLGTTVLATLVALAALSYWRWLLLVGALLELVVLLAHLVPSVVWRLAAGSGATILVHAQTVAATLVLIAVLSCAQALVRGGTPAWGAAVAGAAVGTQLVVPLRSPSGAWSWRSLASRARSSASPGWQPAPARTPTPALAGGGS
jgi:hypothetical protein